KQTRVGARRWRLEYSELAGLSAASSGIEAAIVTTRRATVLRVSTQVATSASLTCSAHVKRNRVPTIVPAAFPGNFNVLVLKLIPPAGVFSRWLGQEKGGKHHGGSEFRRPPYSQRTRGP